MLKIEAVTVCVNYADFLSEVAKVNRGLFDDWVIVTEASDMATREVCRRMNLRCLLSHDGRRGGDFAKGSLVERGLQHLSADGWRLHIDADVALPHDFRHRLLAAHLQQDVLYGVDRLMVKSWAQWQQVIKSGYLQGGQYDYHCRTTTHPGLPVGTRWCHPQHGYVPIGFFQLWHSSEDEWHGVRVKPYPQNHGNACRTDVQHGLQWDRHKRELIPELFAVHLESEQSPRGANWNGRTTAQFGPVSFKDGKIEATQSPSG
jgi:hypothetical protein